MKGMFLFTICKFLYYITMSMGRGRGSNKLLHKKAAPRSEPYQLYRVLLTGKAFLSYVAPSLKHLSQTCGPTTSDLLDKTRQDKTRFILLSSVLQDT